jgi:hypothetical protein
MERMGRDFYVTTEEEEGPGGAIGQLRVLPQPGYDVTALGRQENEFSRSQRVLGDDEWRFRGWRSKR